MKNIHTIAFITDEQCQFENLAQDLLANVEKVAIESACHGYFLMKIYSAVEKARMSFAVEYMQWFASRIGKEKGQNEASRLGLGQIRALAVKVASALNSFAGFGRHRYCLG